jgi:hypothetical protein
MPFFVPTRFLPVLGALLLAHGAQAQAPSKRPLPSFFTTYNYTAYTVYDATTDEPPTEVSGVGGTLTLRPTGAYEKRFSILMPGGPKYFRQDGTFTITGDSIRFAFTDLKGADVQRGTFRYNPATQRLTLTILGYPVGNKGVYELVAAGVRTPPAPAPVRPKPAKKRRS